MRKSAISLAALLWASPALAAPSSSAPPTPQDLSAYTAKGTGASSSASLADRATHKGIVLDARLDGGSCTWDATHDVVPCINAAIAAVAAAGGGKVILPSGVFGAATELTLNASGVSLEGQGVGFVNATSHIVTRLTWIGAAGGTMFDARVPSGALYGSNVTGIVFDCANLANVCAQFSSIYNSTIKIGVLSPVVTGVKFYQETTSFGTANNDIWLQSYATSPTSTGTLAQIDSAMGSDFYFNRVHDISVRYGAGDGIVIGRADNNVFDSLTTYKLGGGVVTYGKSCVFANTGYASPNGYTILAASDDSTVRRNDCGVSGDNASAMQILGPASSGFAANVTVLATDAGNNVPDPFFDTYATGWSGRSGQPFLSSGNAAQPTIYFGNGNGFFGANTFSGVIGDGSSSSTSSYSYAIGRQSSVGNAYNSYAIGDTVANTGINTFSIGASSADGGLSGKWSWANGKFAVSGDAQTGLSLLRGTGSSTTPVRLTSNSLAAGTTNCVNIPTNSGFALKLDVMAFDHSNPANAESWFDWSMMLTRGAGNATLVAATTPAPLTAGTVTGSSISVTADTTNQCLNISFTPPTGNADTWNVVARVQSNAEVK